MLQFNAILLNFTDGVIGRRIIIKTIEAVLKEAIMSISPVTPSIAAIQQTQQAQQTQRAQQIQQANQQAKVLEHQTVAQQDIQAQATQPNQRIGSNINTTA